MAKRLIDIAVAGGGLLTTIWLLPLIALAIYLDSPGPILFRQRRAGRLRGWRHGHLELDEFDMLKFRSMRPDAEKYTGAVLAQQDDPRVTRVGKFLRKTRLDELPQLWNVLKGDMSLVGPRPERPELFRNLAAAIPFFEERMRGVQPGITGYAQVSLGYSGKPLEGSDIEHYAAALTNPYDLPEADGCEADDMRMKLLFDLAYVARLETLRHYLPLELFIIVKTPWVMLRGLGR